MNTRKLHHVWTRLRLIRPWYFFAVGGVCLVVSGFALRENNLHMVKLREAVYSADKNNGDVQGALTRLQQYVTAHMNTNLSNGPNAVYPPIQLKYTYDRLRAASDKSTNEQVYTDAQHYCEQQDSTDFSGRNRVPCIQQYVEDHGVTAPAVPEALYKFDFISPIWSPDFAGYSLLATAFFFIVGICLWLVDRWFKRQVA